MGYTSYYTFGLPTFVVVVIGLYALFTGAFDSRPTYRLHY